MEKNPEEQGKNRPPLTKQHLEELLNMIKSVRYGSITLIIQDGIVVQFDKNEKVRLNGEGKVNKKADLADRKTGG